MPYLPVHLTGVRARQRHFIFCFVLPGLYHEQLTRSAHAYSLSSMVPSVV